MLNGKILCILEISSLLGFFRCNYTLDEKLQVLKLIQFSKFNELNFFFRKPCSIHPVLELLIYSPTFISLKIGEGYLKQFFIWSFGQITQHMLRTTSLSSLLTPFFVLFTHRTQACSQ